MPATHASIAPPTAARARLAGDVAVAARAVAPRPVRPRGQAPALDELTPAQREWVARRHEFMRLLDGGATVRDALARTGLTGTRRWVSALRKRYRERGLTGLYDRRWANAGGHVAEAVRTITLGWYCKLASAGPRVIYRQTVASCVVEGLTPPSEPWVKWFLRERVDASLRAVRDGGIAAWERQGAPVARYEPAAYGNDVWQIDHTLLDLWTKTLRRDGTWAPAPVWLTVVLDVFTRAVAGYFLSARCPDAWTTALVLRKAMLPKACAAWPVCGVPRVLVPDHGRDFRAHAVASSVRALGILLDFCPQHYPNMKGEVERFFRTLQGAVLPALPGYKLAGMQSEAAAWRRVAAILPLADLKPLVEHWIVHEYHARVHEGISAGTFDRAPAAYWQESVRLRMVAERDLDVLLLQSDKVRTVTHEGIRLTLKGTPRMVFHSPVLADRWREKVRLRYNPEDLESVLVYSATTHEYLCEATRERGPASAYGHRDIVRERRRVRADLLARMRAYVARVEVHDRDSPHAWDRARAIAGAAADAGAVTDWVAVHAGRGADASPRVAPDATEASDEALPEAVRSMLSAMERHDRRLD